MFKTRFIYFFDYTQKIKYNFAMDRIIKSLISTSFNSNTHILMNNKYAIIFDCGASLNDVKNVIGKRTVLCVFITHSHFDHILNLNEYVKEFDCDVYVSKNGEEKFYDATKNLSNLFLNKKLELNRIGKVKYLKDNTLLKIEDFNILCLQVKGHSNCSFAFLVDEKLISGDLIFENGIGRYDFYDGNYNSLLESIKKVKALKANLILAGHGNNFKL